MYQIGLLLVILLLMPLDTLAESKRYNAICSRLLLYSDNQPPKTFKLKEDDVFSPKHPRHEGAEIVRSMAFAHQIITFPNRLHRQNPQPAQSAKIVGEMRSTSLYREAYPGDVPEASRTWEVAAERTGIREREKVILIAQNQRLNPLAIARIVDVTRFNPEQELYETVATDLFGDTTRDFPPPMLYTLRGTLYLPWTGRNRRGIAKSWKSTPNLDALLNQSSPKRRVFEFGHWIIDLPQSEKLKREHLRGHVAQWILEEVIQRYPQSDFVLITVRRVLAEYFSKSYRAQTLDRVELTDSAKQDLKSDYAYVMKIRSEDFIGVLKKMMSKNDPAGPLSGSGGSW